jgi:hypothetical protein
VDGFNPCLREFTMKKQNLILPGLSVLVLALGLVLAGCDLFNGSSGSGGSGSTTTYTHYFVNKSSYPVTVTVGGITDTVPVDEYRYIELNSPVTTFTYSPANLVKYTGSLNGTVTFTNK